MTGTGLSLSLLGAPSLAVGERPVALSPSSALLCAYLALSPREGRTRTIAAAQLFADCPAPAGRRRLNTAVWRLKTEVRRDVGVDIVAASDDRRVGLSDAVEVTVDISVFEELVTPALRLRPEDVGAGEAACLERAVALHRGRLVEPCDDEWVLAERHRFENLFLTALDYLLRFHGGRGDVGAVAKYGELALDLEPLREDIHRHLLHAYGAAGRDDLVERQFERCRLLLLEELGADPMPETLAAYARYRRGETGPTTEVAALVSELERARREVSRLADSVDRALGQLRQLV
jgi:DNA-binding SARP family transcriptional activator